MGPFEMVVAIVAVSCAAGIINNWLKTRRKVSGADVDRRIDERLETINELQRRVEVLEKIVTDRQYDLKEQIRQL